MVLDRGPNNNNKKRTNERKEKRKKEKKKKKDRGGTTYLTYWRDNTKWLQPIGVRHRRHPLREGTSPCPRHQVHAFAGWRCWNHR
jgi:hypothetical protein